MDDRLAPDRPTWLATALLALLTAWLASQALLPGAPKSDNIVSLAAVLAGVCVAFLASFLVHGLLPAALTVTALLLSARPAAGDALATRWLLAETTFVAVIGVVLLAWSELGRPRCAAAFWLLAFTAGTVALTTVWLDAHQTRGWRAEGWEGEFAGLQRLRHGTVAFFLLTGLWGVWAAGRARSAGRWPRIAAAVTTLAAPAAAFGAARLYAPVAVDDLLAGARWQALPGELLTWVGSATPAGDLERWSWGTGWVVLSLMLVGLWRVVGRGFRQRRAGEMPLAWPIAPATVLVAALVAPAAGQRGAPLTVVTLAALLPVFGVVDLGWILGRQLVLRSPADTA
jgi:hypothetical protein